MTAASLAAPDQAGEQPSRVNRVLDKGAIFAGWVGVGMALVIAIAFELIVAIQSLVFLVAPLAGLLIGNYANARSNRWRPVRRLFINGAYAGLVTGVSLAVLYVLLRLIFVFADSGSLPDGSTLNCQTGPDCTYQRYVQDGRAAELASYGVTDGASFGAYFVREQIQGGALIVMFTLGGALVGAGSRALRKVPKEPLPPA